MSLIFICALLGLLFGGFRGLVIGALVGWGLRSLLQNALRRQLTAIEPQFLESTFAVMGALSKADSVVTREEIRSAERLFDRLRLSAEQRTAAKAAFNRGKSPGFDVDAEVDRLVHAARGRVYLLQLFLQMQLMAVGADGAVHPAEHEMLVRVARRVGLTERDVAQLEALLRAASYRPYDAGSGAWTGAGAGGAGAGARPGAPSPAQRLDDAYAALGLSPSASVTEIKRAYRRLVSQNHPDKIAGRGLPESMRQIAEEKTREINAAYDLIKEVRGFV